MQSSSEGHEAFCPALQGQLCSYLLATQDRVCVQASNQLDGALEYLGKVGSDPVDQAELEEASGVGVEVTHEQLAAAVSEVIQADAELLREDRSGMLHSQDVLACGM